MPKSTKSNVPKSAKHGQEPALSSAAQSPATSSLATDELGISREVKIAEERPLTIFVDNEETTTLMTLGTSPELLTLGYLWNQGLAEHIDSIKSVQVDWSQQRADVETVGGMGVLNMDAFEETSPLLGQRSKSKSMLRQSEIYTLLKELSGANKVYRSAGSVHGCALCHKTEILFYVEDIGRHNAVDMIAGQMWLSGMNGNDKRLYSTGRLTSEVVLKAARMSIPILLSRSGITHLGLKLANELNIMLIARAKGRHFLVYNNQTNLVYDATP